ncbi:nuclease HARBI1 [Elysia marginata]|uniref:Nuclease HARBI1 n=1 Tax=Elysia marginata TaxID=1093978 RepID=A0AAV4JVH4_9GAST|nr:nuclease HARBI1 [Elysia marginata]
MSGVYCCVYGCTSHGRKKEESSVSNFRIPDVVTREGKETEELTRARRLAWIKAINRKGLTMAEADEKPWLRVCSLHFHGGKPAYKRLQNHPDWAPTLNLGYVTDTKNGKL